MERIHFSFFKMIFTLNSVVYSKKLINTRINTVGTFLGRAKLFMCCINVLY